MWRGGEERGETRGIREQQKQVWSFWLFGKDGQVAMATTQPGPCQRETSEVEGLAVGGLAAE